MSVHHSKLTDRFDWNSRDGVTFDAGLPTTTSVRRRPVYERLLRRKHHMPLDPPSEPEKRDAIRLLADPWEDDLSEEALRILDEASENAV